MLTFGLMLLILDYLTDSGILVTLGIILLVVGHLVVPWIDGRPVGGRRHYWSTGASLVDAAVTTVAGPLNYAGANPKVKCNLPQPFK